MYIVIQLHTTMYIIKPTIINSSSSYHCFKNIAYLFCSITHNGKFAEKGIF